MIINLDSYVKKIIVDEKDNVVKPVTENREVDSFVLNLDTTFLTKTNKKIEDRELSSHSSIITSSVSISRTLRVSCSSYTKKIKTNIETIEATTQAQIRSLESHLGRLDVSQLINVYRYPVTYKAHIQYIQNKTNVYHIE